MRWLMIWALVVVGAVSGCTSDDAPTPMPQHSASATGCSNDHAPRDLPSWADTGFRDGARMPYVIGDDGAIAAILWAEHDPLGVPPADDRNNKILWVARGPVQVGQSLHIRASLEGSDQTVTRTVEGGPGPSIVDLPEAGCWSLDLTWGDHQDHLRLAYAPA